MTEKTFTVVGTAVTADGTLKPRWANDLSSRVKILVKAGCTDINLIELPSGMTKLDSLKYLRDNAELNEAELEVVELKIAEKEKQVKRAGVKAALTENVKAKTAKAKKEAVEA
jgi:hypothetical protein